MLLAEICCLQFNASFRLSTSVLSECPVFGVSNLPDFTKSPEVGMYVERKQAGTWNVIMVSSQMSCLTGPRPMSGLCQKTGLMDVENQLLLRIICL